MLYAQPRDPSRGVGPFDTEYGDPPASGEIRTDYRDLPAMKDALGPGGFEMVPEKTLGMLGKRYPNMTVARHATVQYREELKAGKNLQIRTENGTLFLSAWGWRFE